MRELASLVRPKTGKIGFAAKILETGEELQYSDGGEYPMQSVYKLPIGMAVLNLIDHNKLSLSTVVKVDKKEYVSKIQHSPLRDAFPNGTNATVQELLKYMISKSDGTACDVLLRTIGGRKTVAEYLKSIGIKGVHVLDTEKEMWRNPGLQYRNSATPEGILALLQKLWSGRTLTKNSRTLLLQWMTDSETSQMRIKGLLPKEVPVAHKTGSSGTVKGFSAATNDVGIITSPKGVHLAIAIFVTDSKESEVEREASIAKITLAVWNAAPNQKLANLNERAEVAGLKFFLPKLGRRLSADRFSRRGVSLKSMDAICDDSKRLVGALMLTLFFGVLPVCLYAQSASDMKSPTTSDRTKKSSSVIRLDRVEGQTVVALADVGWPVTAPGLKIVLLNSKGKLIKTVSSGEGGRFEIKDIAADEYVLKVEADEMHPLIVPVIVAKTSVVKSHSNHALQLILHLKSDAKKSVASAISNNHLRLELLDRIEKDQTVRKELIQSKDFAPNSKIGTRMSEIDAQNEARMAEVIKKHGFPSPNLVGVDGVEAASLLVQHDSLAFQKKTLPAHSQRV